MTTQFANRREILDVVGIGLRPNGEVFRNPPEENLESVSRNANSCCLFALYLAVIRSRGNQVVIERVPAGFQ